MQCVCQFTSIKNGEFNAPTGFMGLFLILFFARIILIKRTCLDLTWSKQIPATSLPTRNTARVGQSAHAALTLPIDLPFSIISHATSEQRSQKRNDESSRLETMTIPVAQAQNKSRTRPVESRVRISPCPAKTCFAAVCAHGASTICVIANGFCKPHAPTSLDIPLQSEEPFAISTWTMNDA